MEDKKQAGSQSKSTDVNLFDIILIFVRNKSAIFLLTGLICVISIVLYFFIFDLIYESSASIRSSSKSSGLLGALEGGVPDIGGLDDLGIGGGGKSAKELAAYEEILISRRCLEVVINKFGLIERDEFRYMEDAIKSFREDKLKIEMDKVSGVLRVRVLDKDPLLAKQMVEALLDELDKINIELSTTNAKNNREFIEKRYFLAKEELAKAEDSLKSFQLVYGIAPDLQIKAAAQTVFTMEAELKAEEVKLEVIKKILSSDQPEVKTQEAKVNSMRNKIVEISSSTDINSYLKLGNSPQIALSFIRLQRDLEIQTKILAFVLPLYEQAKIEEKRETPTILVLDKPFISERKAKPKRLTMVMVLTLAGFFASYGFFILRYKWMQYKTTYQNYRSDK